MNMYPYYYKRPTYLFLQREFIGYSYLLLGLYDKAKDIFLSLYRDTLRQDYLLNFLYADALSDGTNRELLNTIDPESLTERKYLYYLVKGFYAFRDGSYREVIKELSEAQSLNRYIEDDPEFLYRYAVSAFMEGDWRKSVFYFEQLDGFGAQIKKSLIVAYCSMPLKKGERTLPLSKEDATPTRWSESKNLCTNAAA